MAKGKSETNAMWRKASGMKKEVTKLAKAKSQAKGKKRA